MKYLLSAIAALMLLSAPSYAAPVPESFAELAEKLSPAVVNISTVPQVPKEEDLAKQPPEPFQGFPPGSPFEEFNELFKNYGGPHGEERGVTSLGSGFIIDTDGFIVTNNHVIADAEEITVSLDDNKQYKAKLIARDMKTDLAVLKIDAGRKLPFVKFGDSDKMRVGDWILAVGNPYGLGGTVTAGIISARARDINAGLFDDFLQTDAAINRGNSGGPMFNMAGEVVGINTAIYSPTGGSIGIGFAVPSMLAQPVIDKLKAGQKIERGWLGVKIQTVSDEIADSLGMKKAQGAMIVGVTPGGPAEKSKLQAGDVIVKFNGRDIDTMRKLPRVVAETPIGTKTEIEVWRSGGIKKMEVTVGKLDESEEKKILEGKMDDNKPAPVKGEEWLGMRVAPLTDELRAEYGVPDTARGMLILDVKPNSQADKKAIEAGDIIVEANQKPVRNIGDLKSALDHARSQKRKSVLLYINKDGETLFTALPVE